MTIKKLYEGCKELKQKWTVMINVWNHEKI